jgi:hypothetical protein
MAINVGWSLPQELFALAGGSQQIDNNAAEGVTYRTGLPGKPTSWHLVEHEVRRRYAAGERSSIAAWARVTSAWLEMEHPSAAKPTLKTLSNKLSLLFREMKVNPRK